MFGLNPSANNSSYGAKIANFTEQKFEVNRRNESKVKNDLNNQLSQSQKVQFRKILKPRTKNSIVAQIDDYQQKSMNESRSSRYFTKDPSYFKALSKDENKNIVYEEKNNLKNNELAQQKFLPNVNQIPKDRENIQIKQLQPENILNPQDKKVQEQDQKIKKSIQRSNRIRSKSSFSGNQDLKSSRGKIDFIMIEKQTKPKKLQRINQQEMVNKKKLRTTSSIQNFSPIQKLKTKQRKISLLHSFDKKQQPILSIKREQSNQLSLDQLIQHFQSIQSKINQLIYDKWKLIEQKLTEQKEESQVMKSKLKFNGQQKFSFSRAILQKNIDLQIMNEIKVLKNLNFSQHHPTQARNQQTLQIINQLQKRRSQIIEKALAQSMVESQLLKKYYFRQNAIGLKTSNYKVGQTNLKHKIFYGTLKKVEKQEKDMMNLWKQKDSQPRESISNQSQSKSKFIPHNQEDYQKYRYKHPQYKPNLHPLPQTSYKNHFFNYSNVQIYNPKYKQRNNMIFPITSTLKNSSYKSQFRQFSPQRINYKQLDAYQDKFKQIDIIYMPKKRSESEAYSSRKGSKVNKYVSQLDYVKRLKTQSMVGYSLQRQLTQRIASKFFSTETKDEYHNPQKLSQHFAKSEIKHKNLHLLKYDMKKKYKV